MLKQQSGQHRTRFFGTHPAHALHDRRQVQDQYDSSVAQDGRATHQVGRHDLIVEGFDNQFFLAHQAVHNEPEFPFADVDHQHKEPGVGFPGSFGGEMAEPHQRQSQPGSRAFTGAGLDADAGLHALQNALHYVHAYATSGDLSDFLGGAEARTKYEIQGFHVAQPRGLLGCDQPHLDGFGPNSGRVDTPSIVSDFQNDLVALMVGVQLENSFGTLAHPLPLFRGFDAMADGIAYHVGKRFGNRVQDALVQVGFLSSQYQV